MTALHTCPIVDPLGPDVNKMVDSSRIGRRERLREQESDSLLSADTWRAEGQDLDEATVLVVVTEGATDPDHYAEVVGARPDTIGGVVTATS